MHTSKLLKKNNTNRTAATTTNDGKLRVTKNVTNNHAFRKKTVHDIDVTGSNHRVQIIGFHPQKSFEKTINNAFNKGIPREHSNLVDILKLRRQTRQIFLIHIASLHCRSNIITPKLRIYIGRSTR